MNCQHLRTSLSDDKYCQKYRGITSKCIYAELTDDKAKSECELYISD